MSAIYGMPELSGAGLTEEACRERGLAYEVGRADLALTPRGAIAGRTGLLKVIFQTEDRKLLGVHCIGEIASEIVGIGQMAIRCGSTLNTLATMSFNTPTYTYAYKYAALDGLNGAHGSEEKRDDDNGDHWVEPTTSRTCRESMRQESAGSASIGPGATPSRRTATWRKLDSRFSSMTEVPGVGWPAYERR